MREGWHKFLVAAVIGLTLAIGITSAVNLWRDVGRPFGGFVAGRNVALSSWHLDAATPAWWSGITQAALSAQDRLIALDGYPYDANQGEIYADAYRRHEPFIRLTIARDNATFEKQIPVIPFTMANFIDIKARCYL